MKAITRLPVNKPITFDTSVVIARTFAQLPRDFHLSAVVAAVGTAEFPVPGQCRSETAWPGFSIVILRRERSGFVRSGFHVEATFLS